MAKFEWVSKYEDCGLALPVRKTAQSAGYDLAAAENIVIPSYDSLMVALTNKWVNSHNLFPGVALTLDEMATLTKSSKAKPTLVSTGLKCKLDPGTYLELSVRSSTPLKHWLILANGVGRL